MKKTVIINNEAVEYELTYKKVKNINLRISRDGRVSVSAPKRISEITIEKFILEKSDFITKALKKFSEISAKTEPIGYNDGEYLLVLGAPYKIKKQISGRANAVINNDGSVTIFVTEDSFESAQKSVLKLYTSICERDICNMCKSIFKDFSDVSDIMPQICFRKTRNRWGTCYSDRRSVILNNYLAALPESLIKYVIYHEFTHLIHANHSRSFYEELKKRCPEHESLRKQLKGFSYLLK